MPANQGPLNADGTLTVQGIAGGGSWITLTNLTLSQQIEIWHDDGTNLTDPVNATQYYRVVPGQ